MGSGASSKPQSTSVRPVDDVVRTASVSSTVVQRSDWAHSERNISKQLSGKNIGGGEGLRDAAAGGKSGVISVQPASNALLVAADVGGTNSRFMFFDVDYDEEVKLRHQAPGKLLFVKKYSNIAFACFNDVVAQAFKDAQAERITGCETIRPEVACFAVAGIVQQNRSRLTNLDWLIDASSISERFGIRSVEIINDFVAQGYGVLTLGDDEVEHIAGPQPAPGAPVACIGAGTGLGQCFLTASGRGEYMCWPSEGGHAEFAPRGAGNDETQLNLLKYLKVKFSGWNRISFERVVSGKGICNVYEFLAYANPHRIDKVVHDKFLSSRQDAGIIAQNAKPDTLCLDALRIFADAYGSVCGTFALQVMPFGGLYLTGGVTQKLRDFMTKDGTFMESYFDKGRVSPMLRDIPLFFVKGDEMGQRGAHLRGVRLLQNAYQGLAMPKQLPVTEVNLAPPRDASFAAFLKQTSEIHKDEKLDVHGSSMEAVKISSPR